MINKEYYINNLPQNLPIFHLPVWLNAVCGNDWDVALCLDNEKITASMPYYCKIVNGGTYIVLPPLTQFLGPHFSEGAAKKSKVEQISSEIDLLEKLYKQLPPFKVYDQHWSYTFQNWLPFYWHGFSQSTRYTYVIEETADIEFLWNNFRNDVRSEIRKGEKLLNITSSKNNAVFYELMTKTYVKQNLTVPYSFEFIDTFINTLDEKSMCKIFNAEDKNGVAIGTLLLVWDEMSVYYLVGALDTAYKYNGAMSCLIWEGIKFASQVNKKFDFEGSMIQNIEKFFRKFGGAPLPYFRIYKSHKSKKEMIKEGLISIKEGLLKKNK
jgi:hypothetical protein